MKYIDINRKFTERVSEYMIKGYVLNSATMNGSQGERAHIDLTNGAEIIRILVDDFNYDEDMRIDGIEVVVGRVTDDIIPNADDTWSHVWNQNLEVLSRDRFYILGESRKGGKFFGTKEEAVAARNTRYVHWDRKRENAPATLPMTGKRLELAKRIVRTRLGIKRIDTTEIKMSKSSRGYVVAYRNKAVTLH